MRSLTTLLAAAGLGAVGLAAAGSSAASAADLAYPQAQNYGYPPPPPYYGAPPAPPPAPNYGYLPPAAYPPPPPPRPYYGYGYGYGPPPVVPPAVVPEIDDDVAYGHPGYGPYVARGYGYYYDHRDEPPRYRDYDARRWGGDEDERW